MTANKRHDAPIPLTDELGDMRALIAPERDPVTGAPVAAAFQRAAKYSVTPVTRPDVPAARAPAPSAREPRRERSKWSIPVGVVAALLAAAGIFVAIRQQGQRGTLRPLPSVTTTAPAPTTAQAPSSTGPLAGFDGTYRLSVDKVHVSAASGGFTTSPTLVQSGSTVTVSYDGPNGRGDAAVVLPSGSATVTCKSDGWTCDVEWSGPFKVMIDGHLARPVLVRADGSPFGRQECNLPIPTDGSLTPKFGLVDEKPRLDSFRVTTGVATGSDGTCDNAVVVGYDLTATRVP
jgi:hypothetical protein